MMTSVFREILYHSLNGDKVYGGELIVDRLIVPTPDSAYYGTGSIDGPEYKIGYNRIIAYAGAESIVAKPSSPGGLSSIILVQNASGTPLLRLGQISSASYIELLDYNVETRLTPTLSYFKQKVLIGSDSATVSGKLRVIGGSEFDSITVTSSANFPLITPTAYDFQTASGTLNTAIENIQDLKGIADPLEPLVLAGSGRLTYDIVTQLGKMPAGIIDISANEWTYLSTMQDVSTTGTPNFASVFANYFVADHATSEVIGFVGRIDPNGGQAIPRLLDEYSIKSYEERAEFPYTAWFYLSSGSGDSYVAKTEVGVKFVVVGKLCTMYIYPITGNTIVVTNATSATLTFKYLSLDLRGDEGADPYLGTNSIWKKVWQPSGSPQLRYPLTVTYCYPPDYNNVYATPYSCEAIMPYNYVVNPWSAGNALPRGITIGIVPAQTTYWNVRPALDPFPEILNTYSLVFLPLVFTWITQ